MSDSTSDRPGRADRPDRKERHERPERQDRPERPDFRIEVHQNKYLPAGDTQVHSIVMVEAEGGPGAMTARSTNAAEVIIVDTSGSMVGERLAAAKRAARAAVDALRDGVEFAIISGSDRAAMVYPRDPLPTCEGVDVHRSRGVNRFSTRCQCCCFARQRASSRWKLAANSTGRLPAWR